MSDEDRKQTVQIPSAANAALTAERLLAFERRQGTMDGKLDTVLRKLDALMGILEHEAQARERGDGALGRSLDRLDEKLSLVARIQGEQTETIGELHALARAAVDGAETANRKLEELLAHGVESAGRAQHAE